MTLIINQSLKLSTKQPSTWKLRVSYLKDSWEKGNKIIMEIFLNKNNYIYQKLLDTGNSMIRIHSNKHCFQ